MAAGWIPPVWLDDVPLVVEPGHGRHVLLLDDAGLDVHRVSWRERLLARVHADSLDRALAAGAPPETDVLLALRAERLARPRTREMLARTVERLLRASQSYGVGRPRTSTRPSMAVLPRVAGTRADLQSLIERLRAPVPLSARGVADTCLLLRDGSGPMYRYESTADLGALVRRIAAELDPSRDWPGEGCR